jgi:hypothetical protein
MSYRERNSLIKASKEEKFNKMMKRRADVVVSVATVALAKSQPIFKRKNLDCHHWSCFHAGKNAADNAASFQDFKWQRWQKDNPLTTFFAEFLPQ